MWACFEGNSNMARPYSWFTLPKADVSSAARETGDCLRDGRLAEARRERVEL